MKTLVKNIFGKFGLKVVAKKTLENPYDLEKDFYSLYEKCKPYTMTSTERLYSLYKSVEYITANKIEGDIVECGVWKGGSSMMAALSLAKQGDTSRSLYMYDTYEGMSVPTEKDVNYVGETADKEWEKNEKGDHNDWCYSSIDEVKSNLKKTNYPQDKINFVKGKVEDTIPGTIPGKIAILRLDTDWYESTYHELKHLYPLLVPNGVLIIDDYGYWKGAREATDTYFKENNIKLLMNRIDTTGRILVKNIL
jgi:hypothetical protein